MSQRWSEYARRGTPRWPVQALGADPAPPRPAQHVGSGVGAGTGFVEERFRPHPTSDDILASTALPGPAFDTTLINPPFILARQFIEQAMTMTQVAFMLPRHNYDCAKIRIHLLGRFPSFAEKLTLVDRIVWIERRSAAPSENDCWLIRDTLGAKLARVRRGYHRRAVRGLREFGMPGMMAFQNGKECK